MRPRTLTALAAVGLAVAAPAASLAAQPQDASTTLGTGSKTCTIKHHASCKGITHHRANLAGRDLRGAHFEKAKMHHADFRQADLRGARFDGAKLRGADFSGARLKGAHFEAAASMYERTGKRANQAQPAPSCNPNCSGADLRSANFTGANLSYANLSYSDLEAATLNSANLTSANLIYANLSWAYLTNANLNWANLFSANLTSANLTGAAWNNTTCPDGTVTYTGC